MSDFKDIASLIDTGLTVSEALKRVIPTEVDLSVFVNNSTGEPNIDNTNFDAATSLAINTWESVGPTGSGATNIWTSLDTVPSDAVWVEVRVRIYLAATNSGAAELDLYARKGGSSATNNDDTLIAIARSVHNDATTHGSGNICTHKIPIDSSSIFDLRRGEVGASVTVRVIWLHLIGYGYNG